MNQSIDFGLNRRDSSLIHEWKREVLVIVGNRFGMKNVEKEYFPAIKRFMKLQSFVGLVGGQPKFAYYFCGLLERPTESG